MKATAALSAMALPTAVAAGLLIGGAGVWVYEVRDHPPPPSPGAPRAPERALPPGPPPADDGSPATYVGVATCKKCHIRQHQSWARSRMASSFDALKPCDMGTYEGKHLAERRGGAGLDPARDYRAEPKCLRCHTTGYGRPGGYPEAVTRETAGRAERLRGVQCEACHGPGSRYVPFFAKIQAEGGTYRRSEVLALGLILPDRGVCLGCHNAESPFVPREEFDFEAMKAKGTHEHTLARQRAGEDDGGEGPR